MLLTARATRLFERKVSHPQDTPLEVVYGGERAPVVSKVHGELEALVVPGSQDNLVSFSDFTNKGSTVLLSSDAGIISYSLNDKQIVLKEDIGTWRLHLPDIANYDHMQDSASIYSTSISKTKLARYITIHERSCHQPAEVLIRALEGYCTSWIRTAIVS